MEADTRAELRFRNPEEKRAAVKWAEHQGHQSLNAYFMWLYRQDVLKNTKATQGEKPNGELATVRPMP